MTPTEEIDTVTASLEVCAERAGDIVPAVFARFFETDTLARNLMEHSDVHMQGRMLESVVDLFISDGAFGAGNYLEWELDNHLDAYAATPAMYRAFFQGLVEVVADALETEWPQFEAAWQRRVALILDQVEKH